VSKIALSPDSSGTGTFTIASPNSNSNRTMTLPDEAGTVVIKDGSGVISSTTMSATTMSATNISDGTNTTATTNVVNGSAKAWANFSGISATVNEGYNVTSITDNGVGLYVVNLTNAMPDIYYAVTAATNAGMVLISNASTQTASSFPVSCGTSTFGAFSDHAMVQVAIFR